MDRTHVLLAGATGMLGSKIARALLSKGDSVDLRVLVRTDASDAKAQEALASLIAAGAKMVEGDLLDAASLDAATKGVHVVVSAVQGGNDVIVGGQVALAEASRRNGVRRILPSDFAIDLFQIPADEHVWLGPRRRADEAIAALGIGHLHVLNGAFMEVFTAPFFGVFDLEHGTATHWGDGNTVMDLTTTDDTALYVAEAVLDHDLPDGKFCVAGDQLTMREAIAAVGDALGRPLAVTRRGSESELEAWIAKTKVTAQSPNEYAPGQYQVAMERGRGKLGPLANSRYPHIRPKTFREFLAAANLSGKLA